MGELLMILLFIITCCCIQIDEGTVSSRKERIEKFELWRKYVVIPHRDINRRKGRWIAECILYILG